MATDWPGNQASEEEMLEVIKETKGGRTKTSHEDDSLCPAMWSMEEELVAKGLHCCLHLTGSSPFHLRLRPEAFDTGL